MSTNQPPSAKTSHVPLTSTLMQAQDYSLPQKGLLSTPKGKETGSSNHTPNQLRIVMAYNTPRVDIPVFKGSYPNTWLRRCNKYFQLYGVLDDQRVELASLFLETNPIDGSKDGSHNMKTPWNGQHLRRKYTEDLETRWWSIPWRSLINSSRKVH